MKTQRKTAKDILADAEPLMLLQWDRLCQEYPELYEKPVPALKLNGRFTRTAGKMLVETRVMELGTRFFLYSAEYYTEMLMQVMPHELCHQADFDLHGDAIVGRWHGRSWQTIMESIGLCPNPYHTMDIVK